MRKQEVNKYVHDVIFVMEEISCSESTEPLEFDKDTLIESSSGLYVAVERCPLCSESKRPFYCKRCVETGKFIHSNATYPDRQVCTMTQRN